MTPIIIPADLLTEATHPIALLDQIAIKSLAQARRGLAEAIGDIVALTCTWPPERIAALDADLADHQLPSLTFMRVRFSKALGRILRRGEIRHDDEFRLVRNAADLPNADTVTLQPLLDAYERHKA